MICTLFNRNVSKRNPLVWGFFLALMSLAVTVPAALDEESCLMCHGWNGLSFAESVTAEVQHFAVDAERWTESVHGGVSCRDCHRDVQEIPHLDVDPVDCGVACHLVDPATNHPFTHEPQIAVFDASVHGAGSEEDPYAADRPQCLDCHSNGMFTPHGGAWGATEELVDETLVRCNGCHQDDEWSARALTHVVHRMRRHRPQEEVVRMCTECHGDADRMARHGLPPMWDFRDSHHWRLILLGDPNAPDCLSCHVPVGYSAHEIHPADDAGSPISAQNMQSTCNNAGGAQSCHPGATEAFAKSRIHFSDRQALDILRDVSVEQEVREALATEMGVREATSDSEKFRHRLLGLISLFYKIMIGVVIGSMTLHQVLDFFAQRRHLRHVAATGEKK